jgi:hypothetical protein
LGAHGAVSWLLGKLDAAESVWAAAAQVAASVGGCFAAADYALVPSGEADLDFFCSEYSNEVLEAAGVRNDDDDFFKVRHAYVFYGCGMHTRSAGDGVHAGGGGETSW